MKFYMRAATDQLNALYIAVSARGYQMIELRPESTVETCSTSTLDVTGLQEMTVMDYYNMMPLFLGDTIALRGEIATYVLNETSKK